MENKVLEENIDRIAKYNKELANKILRINSEKSNIFLCQNENGEYNLIYKDTLLHSEVSAKDEASKIVSQIEQKDNENTIRIIYGLGLGYLPDELSNQINGKIIIYEPNIEILNFVFSIAKIDAIFNENVYIASNEKDLSDLVGQLSNTKTKMTISFLSSYKKLFFEDIQNALNIAQKAQGQHFANKNTLSLVAPFALANSLKNLKYILKNNNISDLKDIYKGKTALCISSGPSLRENIELIKNNQNKFVLIAVNTALKLLKQYDIKPDFVVCIETGDTTAQYKDIDLSESHLILEGFCANPVFKTNAKSKINYLSNTNFINPWIRNLLGLNDNLETLGTVSYTALMSAVEMGFEKIILIGQDLAYKDGRCYAQGSQFEDLECVYNEKLKKYEIVAKDFKKYYTSFITKEHDEQFAIKAAWYNLNFLNKNIYTVKSQTGKDIITQTGYALFIECFEEAAKKIKELKPQIQLINASVGGAQINGYENISLKELIDKLEGFEKIKILPHTKELNMEYINKEIKKLKIELDIFLLKLKELLEISLKLLKELKLKKIYTSNAQKLSAKQEKLLIEFINSCANNSHNLVMLITGIDIKNLITEIDYEKDINYAIEYLINLTEKLEKYNKVLSDSVKEIT